MPSLADGHIGPALIDRPGEGAAPVSAPGFPPAPAARGGRWGGRAQWVAAAAMLLLAVGGVVVWSRRPVPVVVTAPPPPPPAATLAASAGARWEGRGVVDGTGLAAGRPLVLAGGCVEIRFAAGAKVIVEGPARVTVDSPVALSLAAGRLVAAVPGGGFVVKTPAAVFTDLGTEFGVSADADGTAHVEVFTGKVRAESLAPGGAAGASRVLTEGQAATASAAGVVPDSVGAAAQRFVRRVDGQAVSLDVVDLACGGDGTSHKRGWAIDPRTANVGNLPPASRSPADNRFRPIVGLPVLAGCFVPDGLTQVDPAGHLFGFPRTDGHVFNHIRAGGEIPIPPADNPPISPVLGGIDYARAGHGLLSMHANCGLTFDLAALRRLYPGGAPAAFRAVAGNSVTKGARREDVTARADVFVLVDGVPRFERRGFLNKDGPFPVEVPLRTGDRFLTLAVTDGGDGSHLDHVLFGDPRLEMSGR